MSEALIECTGKCKTVDTYKAINKALTTQNSDFKNSLGSLKEENKELQQIILQLRMELIESRKSRPLNVKDASEIVALATSAFETIGQIVQENALKIANFNAKVLADASMGGDNTTTNSLDQSASSTPKATPNVSRIRPIIRTPNGYMQNVSISLPRIDASLLASATDRLVNSTTVSQDLNRDEFPDATRDSTITETLPVVRLPRHTSDLHLEDTIESPPTNTTNPAIVEHYYDQTYDEEGDLGLSVIPEVTEIEYTVNNTPSVVLPAATSTSTSDDSSGGEEIEAHATARKSMRISNKENNRVTVAFNASIMPDSCSTPLASTSRATLERASTMKEAKVVLQPLNMDQMERMRRARCDSESSVELPEMEEGERKGQRKGRKRKESERSETTDTDDDSFQARRPRRRVTPVSFKEPSLMKKLRRP